MRHPHSRTPTNDGCRRIKAYGEEQEPLCAWTLLASAFGTEPLGRTCR
jgi:hypothetical protein